MLIRRYFMKKINSDVKKRIMMIFSVALAVAILAIATVLLWWHGVFLPGWIQWKSETSEFGETFVTLKGRRLTVTDGEGGEVLWQTQADWFVQDMVIKDIDRDGKEEMILLVWKHGSYGEHLPFWEKKNDVALRQHIFIYHQDAGKASKLRALWMSSQILYEITSISSGKDSFLNVTDRTGNTRVWTWRDFGLKLVR